MLVPITALYAGLLGLVGLVLGAGAGWLRPRTGVSVGDGGNPDQLVAMRRHANFAEWVPLALLLIAILELNEVSGTVVHGLGATLFVSRVCHPLGLHAHDMRSVPRAIGALGTVLVTLVAALWSIATFF